MRVYPCVPGAFALLVVACSPSSGGPQGGGQTGDPGVQDFTSLDPDIDPGMGGVPGAGSCRGATQILGLPFHYVNGARYEAAKLSETHVALFDEARGLAIVDTSQAAPRLSSRVPMPRSAGNLHVSGQHAFVSRRNVRESASFFGNGYPQIGDDAELIAVDLSDPTAPRVADRVALERAPRLSMLVASEGRTRIYVLSDGGAAGGCASFDTDVYLTSYEWTSGRLVQRAVLKLENTSEPGLRVMRLSDKLAVLRTVQVDTSYASQLSFVSLAAVDGTMVEGASAPTEVVHALYTEDRDTLRVLSSSSSNTENQLEVYDVGDALAPELRSRCTFALDFLGGNAVTFTAGHTFIRSGHRGDGINTVTSVALGSDGSCEVGMHRGRGRSMSSAGVLANTRVLDIEANELGDLTLRLLDDADLRVINELTVPGAGEGALDGVRVLPGAQDALIFVGVYDVGANESSTRIQLFQLAADSISAHGKASPASTLFPVDTEQVLVWTQDKLARLDLSELDRPQLSGALDVVPSFSHVVAFDKHWLRLRSGYRAAYRDEISATELFAPSRMASLESLPIDQDPDLGDDVARVEANPYGRLVRVGSRLVSIARGYRSVLPGQEQGPVPTLFEVFDVSDPASPQRVGELQVDALWHADPCAHCTGSALDTRDLALQDALVLRTRSAGGALALRVLSLSDPAQPRLSDELARPESEPILSAFTDGVSVYYTYRERNEAASATPHASARFYFRRIDLSDPSAPRIGERVNVPGQLIEIRDSTLFTREFARPGDGGLELLLHRLTLEADKARLEATRSFGRRTALDVELGASGHLLVDLRESLETLLYGTQTAITPTDLHVLDAETLASVGEAYVGPGATRLSSLGNHALYSAAQGVVLMDLADPTAPRAQAYIPIYGYGAGQGTLAGDSVVLEDSGALKRFGLDTTNLP